jgi:hypothetical protein
VASIDCEAINPDLSRAHRKDACMSDTVSGAIIVSSLGNDGPTFLSLPDLADSADLGTVHVPGAAHAEPLSFGLLVDFSTLSPDLQVITQQAGPTEQSASVTGYSFITLDEKPPVIPGALHTT